MTWCVRACVRAWACAFEQVRAVALHELMRRGVHSKLVSKLLFWSPACVYTVRVRVRVCVRVHVHVYVRVRVRVQVHVCVCVCVHVRVHVHVRVRVHAHARARALAGFREPA